MRAVAPSPVVSRSKTTKAASSSSGSGPERASPTAVPSQSRRASPETTSTSRSAASNASCTRPMVVEHTFDYKLSAIGDHLDALDGDHALLDHLVECGKNAVDLLDGVDDLDHHGQVFAQPQDPRRMEARVRAEALEAADDGRSGKTLLPDALDDRLVERLPVPRVGLADEDPKQLSLALPPHQTVLPSTMPPYSARSPAATLPATFAAASAHAPSSARR